MRFGLSDLDELPSLKEFEALAREALGAEEGMAPPVSEEQVSELHPETDPVAQGELDRRSLGEGESTSPAAVSDTTSASTITEALGHVEQELTAAEQAREHEALATSEGMPSGELDEDPPSAKSTSAD
jgi:hypothetical protein